MHAIPYGLLRDVEQGREEGHADGLLNASELSAPVGCHMLDVLPLHLE